MQIFRFFTTTKLRAIHYLTSQGHFWPLLDAVGDGYRRGEGDGAKSCMVLFLFPALLIGFYSLCPVRLLRFNEQRVTLKIPWMFVSEQYSSFFFLLSRDGKKVWGLATFFLWLLAWLAPVKGSCLQKDELCAGEKLAKQPCLAAVKQRLTKAGVCMEVNCMYKQILLK